MITDKIISARTVGHLFRNRIEESGSEDAYEVEVEGRWVSTTWREYGELVSAFSTGLKSLGIESGMRAAIWGNTTPQWTIADLGIMSLGGCSAGIYQTCTADQAAYIISDSGARVVIVDTRERLDMAMSVRDDTPEVMLYVLWEGEASADECVHSFGSVLEMGRAYEEEHPGAYGEMIDALTPDTTAVLVYTSGTTGPPKGAMLSHRNCLFCSEAMYDRMEDRVDKSAIAFLPLSHVAEHVVGFIGRIYGGTKAYFIEDMLRFTEIAQAKHPTLVGGVPRLFEKAYTAIMGRVSSAPPGRQKLFAWALKAGIQASEYRMADESVPLWVSMKFGVADALVLSKIRGALGGEVDTIVCGAAPISADIVQFFNGIGIPFYEVYGMTESSGISHINSVGQYKVNTVGTVVKGFECRIAEDGEILIKGDGVFQGYLNKPEATAETIDSEGWLHTGDIGEVDAEGFLRITDRKKNLLITAGGKNVAPSNIEVLITREPLISQVVVIGDRRRFLSALITISAEGIAGLQETEAFSGKSAQEILESDHVRSLVEKSVGDANSELARYENIRRYEVLPVEFTEEKDEMTPTMKIKRRVVLENYADVIEGFYAEEV